MKNTIYYSLFIGIFLFSQNCLSQKSSIVKEITNLTKLTTSEITSFAPHFPLNLENDEATKSAMNEWYTNYPNEFEAFVQNPKYQENKFAWFPFGIENGNEKMDTLLNDDLLHWLSIYSISTDELNTAAPHFPNLPATENKRNDAVVFNHQKVEWLQHYPWEFKQLMRLVYEDYGKEPKESPDFRSYRPTTEKPVWKETPDAHKIVYEMKLQHWYYMFDSSKYKQLYGEPPALPEKYNSMEEYIHDNVKNDN